MQVRLAFSVMVHVDADVLLIDEVLAVGDAAFQQKCHDALQAARDSGRTILLVTHDMNAVQRFCDRAMLLEEGRVLALGDPRSVAQSYNEINFRRRPSVDGVPGLAPQLGDGAAAIVDTWFAGPDGQRVEMLSHGSRCAVGMRVEFRETVSDPMFGAVVSDSQHRMVLAVSSESSMPSTGRFEAGEVADVLLRFDNVLASGRYFASTQVTHRGPGQRYMDYREAAASVVVTGARNEAGIVDLPHDVEIARVAAEVERVATR
jgi:hypothetical protein